MSRINWKNLLPEASIFLVFVLASLIYFWPAAQGKVVYAGDFVNGKSAVQESVNFHKQTGEYTFWTGSMFAGMPNYQIGGNGGYIVDKILQPLRWLCAWGNRNTVFVFLYYLIAFFLLMRAFSVERWLAMAGAFATAMSSYFFIIIAAAHGGKCYSITWMTLVIIGFVLLYRKQYGWGALMVMFFTYIGFFLHPQMSYYICMLIGVLFFAELALAVQAARSAQPDAKSGVWKAFAISTLIFFASFAVGMGMGSANVFTNQEYASQTMRGGHSDLVKATDEHNRTAGLDLDYATAWSYGINETMTFLIPNFMGGASGYDLGEESLVYKELVKARVPKSSARQFCKSAPTYRGEKAFTSGPVYMGAIVCMLFVLALLIVPGPYKWALLAATLFSLLLSWGRHLMPLTELFFNNFPMYNKFRAVESILIVAEITMPLLALLAVKQWVEHCSDEPKRYLRALGIAAGITGGICLLFALFGGSLCSFESSYDSQWKGQVGDQIYKMILDQRAAMMRSDAWRSLLFILLGAGVLFVYQKKTFKTTYLGVALTVLFIADLWPVDKRFCNDSVFVTPKDSNKAFAILPYEQHLLDTDQSYYRVLNLTTNTFNDARTSYYLRSIGGYSAAKLRRYQDLIDEHLSKMNWGVINMLNTKYIISQGQDGQPYPFANPDAMGPCWLADSLLVVDNANDESDALRLIDITHTAVIDKTLPANAAVADWQTAGQLEEGEQIDCVRFDPNRLEYVSRATTERLAVFSEIYYPFGWKATIDDMPVEIARVNYLLRAIVVPAGEHRIVMRFEPDSIRKGNILSLICFAIMIATLIAVVIINLRRTK